LLPAADASTSRACRRRARGVAAAELEGKPVELALPSVLVRLALEHDRVLTY
jgi:hypothetical protein